MCAKAIVGPPVQTAKVGTGPGSRCTVLAAEEVGGMNGSEDLVGEVVADGEPKRAPGICVVGVVLPWQGVVVVLAVVVGLTALALSRDARVGVVRVEQASSNATSTTTTTAASSTTTATIDVASTSAAPLATGSASAPASAAVAVPTTKAGSTPTTSASPTSTTDPAPSTTAPTTTTTSPCSTSASGGVANLRIVQLGREGADLEWDCFPGIDPQQYHFDGAYVAERKGGEYGEEWTARNTVYQGTRFMPRALSPGTEYRFRIAPYRDGRPGVWEEIVVRTNA